MSTIVAARATAGSRKKHRGNSSEGPRSRRPVLFRTQSGRGSLPGIVVPRRWRQSEDVRRLREPDELGRVSGDDASRGGPAEHSRGVSVAGGVVHSVGTLAALAAGSVLLASTLFEVRSAEAVAGGHLRWHSPRGSHRLPRVQHMAVSPAKQLRAPLDQATIFLFIAGTYTPFLVPHAGLIDRRHPAGCAWCHRYFYRQDQHTAQWTRPTAAYARVSGRRRGRRRHGPVTSPE